MSVTRATYALEQLANAARVDLAKVRPGDGSTFTEVIRRVATKRTYTADELAAASTEMGHVADKLGESVQAYLENDTRPSTETAVIRTVWHAVRQASHALRADDSSGWWRETQGAAELINEVTFHAREASNVLGPFLARSVQEHLELSTLVFRALRPELGQPLSTQNAQVSKHASDLILRSLAELRQNNALTPEQDTVVASYENALRHTRELDDKPPVVFENPVAEQAAKLIR